MAVDWRKGLQGGKAKRERKVKAIEYHLQGMTVGEIAKKMGVTHQCVSQYFHMPDVRRALLLAKAAQSDRIYRRLMTQAEEKLESDKAQDRKEGRDILKLAQDLQPDVAAGQGEGGFLECDEAEYTKRFVDGCRRATERIRAQATGAV